MLEVIMNKIKCEELIQYFPSDYFDVAIINEIDKNNSKKLRNEGTHSVSELCKYDIDKDPKALLKQFSREDILKWIGLAKKFCEQVQYKREKEITIVNIKNT